MFSITKRHGTHVASACGCRRGCYQDHICLTSELNCHTCETPCGALCTAQLLLPQFYMR
jgi:hypothetical protein